VPKTRRVQRSKFIRAITVVRTVEICRESKMVSSSHKANYCVHPVDYVLEQMDSSLASHHSEFNTARLASRRGQLMRILLNGIPE
jgi:hypothetical protein